MPASAPAPTWFSSSGSSLSWLASDSSTKANSPPCDSINAVRMLSERLSPKPGPSAARMVDLMTMRPTVSHAMTSQSLASTVVLMLQPVVTKKSPSSSVRKGLMSASTCGWGGRGGGEVLGQQQGCWQHLSWQQLWWQVVG